MEAIALKTDLFVPGNDIVDVARRALDGAGITPEPTDTLAIREMPLAIAQGRIFDINDVRPSIVARMACRFLDFDGRLSTPYAVEVGMKQAGRLRFVLALLAAGPLNLLGRRGDFYRLAGRQVSTDDIPGATPRYAHNIVLGPDDPTGVARRVTRELGCGAAVVDASDPDRVEILGASAFLDRDLLVAAMRLNAQGSDDQQTPLVLVRAG